MMGVGLVLLGRERGKSGEKEREMVLSLLTRQRGGEAGSFSGFMVVKCIVSS
jgi:hypothetical protein